MFTPAKNLCRKCIAEDVSLEELADYLDNYINSLPADIRTDPAEYERRIAACECCDRRIALTCTLCGCYIQARAAKQRMDCPYDKGGSKWR